jgi:1,4-alpha-glucan branching enzyme
MGLPHAGRWREIFNSDAEVYGGSGMGNLGEIRATNNASHGFDASAAIVLPPLSTLYFRFEPDA